MTEQKTMSSGGVSVLISHQVRQDAMASYEHWLAEIIAAASRFPGHQGVNILKPVGGHNRYEIAVRFAGQAEAEAWLQSDIRRALIEEAGGYLAIPENIEISSGIDNWFQPLNPPARQPTRWKQWLLTTLVIWLLTLLVPPALSLLLFEPVPLLGLWGIRHAITAAIIVALVIYVVMPRLVRRVSGWLFR